MRIGEIFNVCPLKCNSNKQRLRLLIIFIATFWIVLAFRSYRIAHYISYLTRPLWDTPSKPFVLIPSYIDPSLSDAQRCEYHGWKLRISNESAPKIFHAFLFSNELDLLDITLHELQHVVDKFILVESNTTFHGVPKQLVFQENRERFKFVEEKIVYAQFPGRKLHHGEIPMSQEHEMRLFMEKAINKTAPPAGAWVLITDPDEIPRREILQLFKICDGAPNLLHLQMRNYLYSFEFREWSSHWRAQISHVRGAYGHGRASDLLLADAGWHCSFCFPQLDDFIFKMQSYSHSDRIYDPSLLDKRRIQKVICEGTDIFELLPEAYDYITLFSKMGAPPRSGSTLGLPSYVLRNREKFSYLLPGGCVRNK